MQLVSLGNRSQSDYFNVIGWPPFCFNVSFCQSGSGSIRIGPNMKVDGSALMDAGCRLLEGFLGIFRDLQWNSKDFFGILRDFNRIRRIFGIFGIFRDLQWIFHGFTGIFLDLSGSPMDVNGIRRIFRESFGISNGYFRILRDFPGFTGIFGILLDFSGI